MTLEPQDILLTVDQQSHFDSQCAVMQLEGEAKEHALLQYKTQIAHERKHEALTESIDYDVRLFLKLAGHDESNLADYIRFYKSEELEMSQGFSDGNIREVIDGYGDTMFVARAYIELSGLQNKPTSDVTEEDMKMFRRAEAMMNLATQKIQFMIIPKDLDNHNSQTDMSLIEILSAVCKSNLTKFDTNIEDAKATQAKYAAMGVETVITVVEHEDEEWFVNRVAKTVITEDGTEYPENKVMKSIRYCGPVLDSFVGYYDLTL